jgi:hypothetical protein
MVRTVSLVEAAQFKICFLLLASPGLKTQIKVRPGGG